MLFALPAWAQSAKGGWIADPLSGCRVWDSSPSPNETITWSGSCTNGLAQGPGSLQWVQNGTPMERDAGEWRDGKLNGHGTVVFPDGTRFDGEWREGRANGMGHLVGPKGSYKGVWADGCFNNGKKRASIGVELTSCP
jgi:hypothetical protein